MYNTQLLRPFAKGKQQKKASAKFSNCIIYTRVSSKEQEENLSLGIQKRACIEYAKKAGLKICGYFGDTSESAKTDERVEFNRMLAFAKKSQHKIDLIIVYSVDRFSRSGPNAIYIASQLKKAGIILYAVTQPTDANTASGSFQQNIQFIFSEYDNELRRQKTTSAMKERLENGDWCGVPPVGYDIVRKDGKKRVLVVNEKGKMIRKAFYWKAKDHLTHEEIKKRLTAAGFKHMTPGRVSWILKNPFYCGILSHNMLAGKLVEGNHEALVSEELFLEVNGIFAHKVQGYKQNKNDHLYPLKRFLKCAERGRPLRASAKTGGKNSYYQCNTKQCLCSRRVELIHDQFRSLLAGYTLQVDEYMRYLICEQMIATYNELNASGRDMRATLTGNLHEVVKKLDRLEERYIMEEIRRESYEKFEAKFLEEKAEIERQLALTGEEVSDIEFSIDLALDFSSKLATVWDLGDLSIKQEIQRLVFSDGMFYNRKNDRCRTDRVNEVFSCIAQGQSVLTENNLTFAPANEEVSRRA